MFCVLDVGFIVVGLEGGYFSIIDFCGLFVIYIFLVIEFII